MIQCRPHASDGAGGAKNVMSRGLGFELCNGSSASPLKREGEGTTD